MKLYKIQNYVFMFCYLLVAVMCGYLMLQNNELKRDQFIFSNITQRCMMYDDKYGDYSTYIGGVAFDDKYYCVWTQGMTNSEIDYADCHERCHIMIAKDRGHFCH